MAYDYLAEAKKVENGLNYCSQQKVIEIDKFGGKETNLFDVVIDSNFDLKKGFTTNGTVSFVLRDSDNNIIKSFKTKGFKESGFIFRFDKSNIVEIKYEPDSNWVPSSALLSDIEFEKKRREITSSYIRDLDFLYYDYFYNQIEKVLEKYLPPEKQKSKTQEDIIDFLNQYNLSKEVSLFAKELVDIYNQSYFNHLEEIQYNIRTTGIDSPEFRYSLCIEDDFFKETLQNEINLLDTSVGDKILGKSNIREDKFKATLDYVLEHEQFLIGISDELKYRSKMPVGSNNFSDTGLKHKFAKECREYCSSFDKNGLISEIERERIKELENSKFKKISDEEIKEYENLVNVIKERYDDYLKGFIEHNRIISKYGYNEGAARINHLQNNDGGIIDYSNLGPGDLNNNFHNYMLEGKSEWDTFLKLKRDDLNAALIHEQISNLEKVESMYAQNNNNLGVNKIDFDKLSIIKKIDSLDSFNESIRISQIESLVKNYIPVLKNIVYSTEMFSGKRNNFFDQLDENSKQIIFGREHYQYLSALDKLQLFTKNYEKNKEELEILNLSAVQEDLREGEFNRAQLAVIEKGETFRRILAMMSDVVSLDLKEADKIKNHICSKNKYIENEVAFGFDFEDISTDGTVDLIKTLNQLKRLTDKYDLLNKNAGEGDSKVALQASNVAANINYIKENILKGLVDTDANLKVSQKDLLAYNSLTEICNNTFILNEISNIQKELETLNTQIESKTFEIDDIDYGNVKGFLLKINIVKNNRKETLENEIKVLEARETVLTEELQQKMNEVQAKLVFLSNDLKKSFETDTVAILSSKGMLSEEDRDMIEAFSTNI